MKTSKPDPLMTLPRHLSIHTRKWVLSIADRYEKVTPEHIKILICAGEAWDRMESARKVVSKKGTSYIDRFGAPRLRPEVSVERDSRIAFLRALRELNLEHEAPPVEEAPKHPRRAPHIPEKKG